MLNEKEIFMEEKSYGKLKRVQGECGTINEDRDAQ